MSNLEGVSGTVSAGGERVTRKGIWGWMFFDWAAQPFFTVVTTFVFGPYVVSRMVDDPTEGQAVWALGVAVAGFFIAFLSPILGSIADKTGPRKPWIIFFAAIKITALSLLWFAEPGSSVVWVLALFILATISAEFSIVFNDSMMPSLVSSEESGRISNIAWGLGYLGGMLVLILVLLFLAGNPKTGVTLIGMQPLFGLDPALAEGDRAAAPLSALWYFIFIMPMLLFTPDVVIKATSLSQAVRSGVSELLGTLRDARQRPGIFRFLIARMVFQDGVNALVALGGTFAAAMFGWSIIELGIFGIILNVVAVPSCLIAARMDPRFGSKKLIIIAIILLIVALLGIVSTDPKSSLFGLLTFNDTGAEGLYSTGAEKVYVLFGILIGAAFGPVQASSRSYLARSIEPSEAGRYFGLYALTGRATSFLAPALVSYVTFASGSATMGMATLLIFFVVGLAILWGTPYPANAVEPQSE